MTDTPQVQEDSLSQEFVEANLRDCRKRLKLTADETDFESATDQLDDERLREYKREVLKVFVAGSTIGQHKRLYDKYSQLAEFIATYVRLIPDSGEPIELGSWSFLRRPPAILDADQREKQSAAIDVVTAEEFTAETLFVSPETAGQAVAFTKELAAGGYDLARWLKLSKELGVEILTEDQGGFTRITLPEMEQLAYRVVADQTVLASIKSGEANKQANLQIISASMATIEKNTQRAALQAVNPIAGNFRN